MLRPANVALTRISGRFINERGLISRGPRGEKRPAGTVECAYEVFQIAVGDAKEKLPSGRRISGKAGAVARARSLSAKERKGIAQKAAAAGWRNAQ